LPAGGSDWVEWHRQYDDPGAPLARRRRIVATEIDAWLDAHPTGPIQLTSICAGQGRDLLPTLAARAETGRIDVYLVELDSDNARFARESGAGLDLGGFEADDRGIANPQRAGGDRDLDPEPAPARPDAGDPALVRPGRLRGAGVPRP
jgi:hypothetical protein